MSKLIHIGFGNVINVEKMISIVSPDAAPILKEQGYFEKSPQNYESKWYKVSNYIERCENAYEDLNFRRFNLSVYQAGQALKNIPVTRK